VRLLPFKLLLLLPPVKLLPLLLLLPPQLLAARLCKGSASVPPLPILLTAYLV
jgi:hypothetical protein